MLRQRAESKSIDYLEDIARVSLLKMSNDSNNLAKCFCERVIRQTEIDMKVNKLYEYIRDRKQQDIKQPFNLMDKYI